jgi:putative DNA primase/helicase
MLANTHRSAMNSNRATAPKAHARVPMLDAALTFFESIAVPLARDRGWKIAPCYPKKKEVHTKLVPQPLRQMSNNLAQIRTWAEEEPNANVCVYAQQIEGGLCFLDRDGERDIRRAYRDETGNDFDTFEVESSPGRSHWYFLQTEKTRKAHNISEDSTGKWFSFRVDNYYVCSIGSIHPKTGKPYKVINDIPLAPMPDSLLEWLQKQEQKGKKKKREIRKIEKIPVGELYPALASETGRLIQRGYSPDLIVKTMLAWVKEHFDGPPDELERKSFEAEIEHLIDFYPPGEPNNEPFVPHMPITETSNANRFAARYAQNIRYASDRKTWCAWDGHIWNVNDLGAVTRQMKDIALDIYEEAKRASSEDLRKALGRWALDSESRRVQDNSIAIARWYPGIEVRQFSEVFDTHPDLLNVQNGTVNLRTGAMHAHRREDFLTKLVPINYNPEAKCPKFMQFLNQSLPGAGMLGYISRFAGYCLTGLTNEQSWFMFYGVTATGKTTLISILRGILGPYAVSMPNDYFLIAKNGADYSTADLAGVRLATSSEINEGKYLDVAKIKALTGEEFIKAQRKYENFFEFRPQCKLLLGTNHRPRVPDTDDSIWRRMKVLPFNAQCPEERRDPDLVAKLLAEESEGILAWGVLGARAWFDSRLSEPDAIKAAVNEYRVDEDVIRNFISERCTLDPSAKCERKFLFDTYVDWSKANDYRHHFTQKKLAIELAKIGVEAADDKRHWIGIVVDFGPSSIPKDTTLYGDET